MIKRFILFLLIALLSVSCNEDTTVGPEDPGSGTSFSILLLSPVGGESVKIGTTKAIRWSSNTTNTIKIELSTDGGTTFTTIAASVANIGIYNWTVPSTASTVCLIRVSDAVNASVNDVTDNFFTIEQNLVKTLSLTSPNGGDTLIAGQSASIQWASANIANVKLQYSSDNGVSWNTIVSSYPADSARYTWSPVPNIFSPDCRIRVADAAADTLFDISDNKFLIRSSQTVTVLSPNSGESLPRGGSYIIAWQATDISSVKIEYSTNDGNSWNVITASTPNDGSHDWNPVADVSTTQGRIRISDAADGTPSDISDGPFSISSQPSITVTSPASGESITAGSRKTINWVSTSKRFTNREEVRSGKNALSPEVNNVAIAYSTDGGNSWTNIVSSLPNTGSYSWDPVPAALTTNGKIRVRDISDTTVFGLSSGFFTIIAAPVKSLTVVSPNGGESWSPGTDQVVTWTSANISTVKIELSTNNGSSWSTLASNIDATAGSYTLLGVPNSPSALCKIRISESPVSTVSDQSDAVFTITPQSTISVAAPNGGESILSGGSTNITWVAENLEFVKIEYTTNNGFSWTTITNSTESDGFYTWSPVPAVFSTNCKIRISDAADGHPFDVSNDVFSILAEPVIQVTAPNGGERLLSGSSYQIQWNTVTPGGIARSSKKPRTETDDPGVTDVRIELSTDGGAVWSSITATTPNTGSYLWSSVPNLNSALCKIRISDAADGIPTDQTDSVFVIYNQAAQSIAVTSPNGGEQFTAGSSTNITWSSSGVAAVLIEFTTNNGVSWSQIANNVVSTGVYTWNPLPAVSSGNCKIRISDAGDSIPSAQSQNTFTIVPQPSVRVISPNGGEIFYSGTTRTINWESASLEKVKLEFTTNNGSSWQIISDSTESDGAFDWSVPVLSSSLCKVRVSGIVNGTPSDVSDAVFSITNVQPQSITVTSPNGGESFTAGVPQRLTWLSAGIDSVKIEYTTNNGVSWALVVNSTVSTGSYIWQNVPSVNSTNCKIRISDALDSTPMDESNAVFSITVQPQLAVTSPNGGESILAGTSHTIQWTTLQGKQTESVTSVKIEFSSDAGLNWAVLTNSTPNTGSYNWNPVPNISSSLCRVRISDAVSGTPSDISDSNFTVYNVSLQTVTVVSPNGGEVIQPGTTYNLTWNSSGIATVNIELTTNNGLNWSTIVNGTESDGFYLWNPPSNVSSTNCKIRIYDAVDSLPSDESNTTFTILPAPTVQVLSPNGGEVYYSGTTRTITWQSSSLEKVKLEFTTNNGSSWQIISDSTESDGAFDWSVPVLASSLCKVRISGIVNGTPSDISDAVFSITNVQPQSITVTSPNGGENFTAGVPQQLTWLSAGIDSAKIEYTTNNGVSWTTIVNSTPSNGSYIWTTVPSVNSANCKIRISDALDNTPTDESNNVFSIVVQPQLVISSPNGGESILAGSAHTIQWTTLQGRQTESVTSVKIEFSSDAGLSWTVLSTSAPNTGSYNWNPVPNISSALCRVRISEAVTGSPSDISDSNFTVYNVSLQTITVTSPNGGEIIQPGGTFNLTWNSSGIATVNIELTTNNGLNWSTVVNGTESDGFYLWTPPSNVSSTNCKIRIYDAADSLPSDESNSTFTILPSPTVQVLSPNGGEQLIAGAQHTITWLSQNISAVKLEFTTNNGAGWVSIADSTESDGQFIWTVPAITSSLCKIRVSNQQTGSPQDISDNVFTITTVTPQSVTVTLPNGGESIPSGSSQVITWTSSGIDSVKIEFTTNNGVSWSTVVNKTESDGFYLWNPVPATSSTNCKIRISDAADGIPSDESNGVFTIAPEPAITVLAPNGGERWTFGTSQDVRWNATNLANVKIEFSTNSGFSWVTIVDSTPSTGSYSWTIPNINSSLCKIRVSDPVDGVPFDISDSNFTLTNQIQQSLTVTSPNGGENFEATSAHSITWTSSAINKVKIEFSTNNGLSWSTVTDSTESDGQYEWNPIPSVSSTLCKVRISDAADGSPVDESNNTFTISPNKFITVLYPDGGENLTAGTVYNILWSSQGVTNVSIEYRIGNTGSYESIISSTPSDGSYEWSPTVPAAFYKLRIKNADDATPLDESNGTFTVLAEPSVTLLTPDGGQSLQAGTSYDITWLSTGLSAVKLELTTNNGASWSTIVDSTESDGSYTWVVNNVNSNLCKIRISDQADGLPASSSSNVFRIYNAVPKTLTVTAPNGGEVLSAGEQTNITWVSSGIDSVKIEFSTNNGQTWSTVVSGIPASGFYLWNPIPNVTSTNCLIRVSEKSTGFPFDVSNAVFTINPEPVLTVLTPNGGESWLAGSQQQIRWLSQNVANVDIDFSSNNGATWSSVVTGLASTGTYTWANVPSVNSDQCRIRVKDAADGSPNDISDSTFAIVQTPYIRVIFPNGGGQSVTSDTTIIWTSVGVTNVDLELTLDNAATAWTTIAANIPSTGAYLWTLIPQYSSLARIRVTAVGDTTIRDMSDGTFNVGFVPPGLTIRKSIGAGLQTGKPLAVPYTSDTERQVTLEYSLDEGNTWLTGAENIQSVKGDNTGLIPWKKEFEGRMIYIRIRSLDSDVQSIPVLISLE